MPTISGVNAKKGLGGGGGGGEGGRGGGARTGIGGGGYFDGRPSRLRLVRPSRHHAKRQSQDTHQKNPNLPLPYFAEGFKSRPRVFAGGLIKF